MMATRSDNTVIGQFILTGFIYRCSMKDKSRRIDLRVNTRNQKWYYMDNQSWLQ